VAVLKNKHRDKRCFIIGNGPSLLVSDLDRLHNEITFASNKIFLAFGETNWRPTYYSVTDSLVAENNHETIRNLNVTKYFDSRLKKYFRGSKDIVWLRMLANAIMRDGKRKYEFSTNLLGGVYGGYTVIHSQLQLAYYMGIREIYLIGVDFKYHITEPTGERCADGLVLDQTGGANHFHPEYRKPGEKWTMPMMDRIRDGFLKAEEVLRSHGGCVYNASRKTALDVFPTVDFDKIISKGATT
jgi:6-hydroxymethylpterin diphosphokinase MptE-like protein